VNKFSSLKNQLPKISASATAHAAAVAAQSAPRDQSTTAAGAAAAAAAAAAGPIGPPGSAGSAGGPAGSAEESGSGADGPAPVGDLVRDCRLLMKTLVLGLKNIVWGITSCNPTAGRDYRLAAGGAAVGGAGATPGVPGAPGSSPWGGATGNALILLSLCVSLVLFLSL
jgi:hypothetical protein